MELNKIACMDCLEYLKQIPDNSVDLVVTDPPYNVSWNKDVSLRSGNYTKRFGDWDFGFDPAPFLRELKRVLKPNGQIYVFCSTKQVPEYMGIFMNEWFFRNILVWYRTNPSLSLHKTNYVFANDYIIYAVNYNIKPSLITFNFSGQSKMHNTIITGVLQGKERLKDENNKSVHPTQKPLSVLKKLIEISSKPGDVVLDPFMGVGSTAVACKELGRNFIGCELNPKYVEWAEKRIKEITCKSNNGSLTQ